MNVVADRRHEVLELEAGGDGERLAVGVEDRQELAAPHGVEHLLGGGQLDEFAAGMPRHGEPVGPEVDRDRTTGGTVGTVAKPHQPDLPAQAWPGRQMFDDRRQRGGRERGLLFAHEAAPAPEGPASTEPAGAEDRSGGRVEQDEIDLRPAARPRGINPGTIEPPRNGRSPASAGPRA